ncbi:hypothetical protein D9M71_825030 [compost metagenome]
MPITPLMMAANRAVPKLSLSAAITRGALMTCQNCSQVSCAACTNMAASGISTIRLRYTKV